MIDILIMILIFLAWLSLRRTLSNISLRLDVLEEQQAMLMPSVLKLRESAIDLESKSASSNESPERQGTYYRSDPRFDKDDGQSGYYDGLDD